MAPSTGDLPTEFGANVRTPKSVSALHETCGVYTRPEIVDAILDAAGWHEWADLTSARLLEPAAGDGAFVVAAARRLLKAMSRSNDRLTLTTLQDRIRAFEIHPGEAQKARLRLDAVLKEARVDSATRRVLIKHWIMVGDFLLSGTGAGWATHVVGNPPYIRWSKLPRSLRKKYERALPKAISKGDLFLPFLDLSIDALVLGGRLGFVCSDRWRYMAFAEDFRRSRLDEIEVEHDDPIVAVNAYVEDVDVYPSILILKKKPRGIARPNVRILHSETLKEAGHVVRVGPALGCTPAFVLNAGESDVEPEILAPWLDAREISEGAARWEGRRIATLHDESGRLRNLRDFPRLAARLKRHRPLLEKRAIVRAGAEWYRPIDRVFANAWSKPKLVLPEIAKVPRVAIDRSGAIPSHGVYAIFPRGGDVDQLYNRLADGKLARAIARVSPMVKGGYFRCYRRFLEQIVI